MTWKRCLALAGAMLQPAILTPAAAQEWQQYARPEEAGFSSERLERTRQIADSLLSGGAFVVYRGKVLVAWGDVSRKLQLHSVRKSLTSALVGMAVTERKIELDATLGALQIEDTNQLTSAEKSATIRDVISARSGIYLPAAYAPSEQDSTRPERGAHAPGTRWFYNNWDFNVAETIYQRQTGNSIYEAFAAKIAAPLGMEDFQAADGFVAYEPSLSAFPAHTWRMSARDLARFGQLFLQRGIWNGKEIVPANWVAQSTAAVSDLGNGRGYGYMWWTYAPNSYGSRYTALNMYASFAAHGSGGQAIIVVPDAQLVIVHRGDTDHNRGWATGRVWALVDNILAARSGEAKADAAVVALAPLPFATQLPPLVKPQLLPTSETEVAALVGEYDIGQPLHVWITRYEGRPFLFMPGRGEAELLRTDAWRYTIAVVPGVVIAAQRDSSQQVAGLTVQMGSRTISARRVP